MDIDGEEEDAEYEEYTWAGQTRVRVTTMLEGGLAGQSHGQWSLFNGLPCNVVVCHDQVVCLGLVVSRVVWWV